MQSPYQEIERPAREILNLSNGSSNVFSFFVRAGTARVLEQPEIRILGEQVLTKLRTSPRHFSFVSFVHENEVSRVHC